MRFLSVEPLLESLGPIDLTGIDWVIVGGEGGAGARPLEESWVLEIQEQCHDANVPFFFKQWGGRLKSKNGRELRDRTYDEKPPRVTRALKDSESLRRALAEAQRMAAS